MSEPTQAPRVAFAVVATGVLTPQGLPCFLTKDGNETFPVLVYVHEDKAKAEKRRNSMETAARRIQMFDGPSMTKAKPFYGVVKVYLPARKPGRKVSKEQVIKMQEGRKAANAEHKPAAKQPAAK